jgi:hypothetical protein
MPTLEQELRAEELLVAYWNGKRDAAAFGLAGFDMQNSVVISRNRMSPVGPSRVECRARTEKTGERVMGSERKNTYSSAAMDVVVVPIAEGLRREDVQDRPLLLYLALDALYRRTRLYEWAPGNKGTLKKQRVRKRMIDIHS